MWDPAVYGRFSDERSRPFFDLTARIGAVDPRAVVDLGCGAGELTAGLTGRWPRARISGIDSSPEMIAEAASRPGPVDFRIGDVRTWQPGPDDDVVITNAVLQWVPGHQELITRWARQLPAGAWLALQVPGNFDAPSHRLLRAVARSPRFAGWAGDVVRDEPVEDAAAYADLLTGAGARVDAWETTYVHLLDATDGKHPVLRWMEGTALRPVKAALPAAEWQPFLAALSSELSTVYPVRHGLVAFPFRRIFVVARTAV